MQALQRISGQLRYDGVQAQGRHLAVTYALAAGHGHREALQQAREQLQGQGVICREASLTRLGNGRVQARLLLAAG